MKEPVKIYLNSETRRKLLEKAGETGFSGRGALTKFVEKRVLCLFLLIHPVLNRGMNA